MPSYRPVKDVIYAFIALPYDPDLAFQLSAPPLPLGEIDYPDTLMFDAPGGTVAVLGATEGFATEPTDDPPNVNVYGIVLDIFNFRLELFQGVEPGGAVRGGFGEIRLVDTKGRLDPYMRMGWDNRELRLYRGPRNRPFADFDLVARMSAAGINYDLLEKQIKLRDGSAKLYDQQMLVGTFDGTGNGNGDAGLAGQLKPQCYGRNWNIEPQLSDGTYGVYDYHDRAAGGPFAARDGGSPLTIMGDYPDYASLIAVTGVPGQLYTCNALGKVRTGGKPAFGLRLDVYGDAFGGYVERIDQIVVRLATTRSPIALSPTDDIDTVAMAQLAADVPGIVGWYWTGATTIGAALDQIMTTPAGSWWLNWMGKLTAVVFKEPDDVADIVVRFPDDFIAEPTMLTWTPPRSATTLGYQHNWSPQAQAGLVGTLTSAEIRDYSSEWRTSTAPDDSTRTKHPSAAPRFVESGFYLEADANAEAVRQQELYGLLRQPWRMTLRLDPLQDLVGKTIEVQDYNRYDFGASKKLRIFAVEAGPGAQSATIDTWA